MFLASKLIFFSIGEKSTHDVFKISKFTHNQRKWASNFITFPGKIRKFDARCYVFPYVFAPVCCENNY